MAVDTKQKRLAMLNFGLPWWTTLLEADGTIDADDRPHLLGLYPRAGAPPVVGGGKNPLSMPLSFPLRGPL